MTVTQQISLLFAFFAVGLMIWTEPAMSVLAAAFMSVMVFTYWTWIGVAR